ncbi:MAG: RnfABCDGE type electron transport complex subunit B [Clostridia bacterium]
MSPLVLGIIIVAGIGIIAGIVLSVASILMAVPKDEKAEALQAVLPGANCGACGFSGCSGYAAAMSKGEAEPGKCPPGGEDCMQACSEILGVSGSIEKNIALVHCLGSYDVTSDKVEYDGIESCSAAALLAGGVSSCRFGCLGMGDCVKACEYDAIDICNGVAVINPDKCKACKKCVTACPKGLISLIPVKKQAVVRCSNCDKGAGVVKICKIGCIGCKKCEKVCSVSAIKVTDFRASVSPDLCIGCGLCAEACPRKIIDMI